MYIIKVVILMMPFQWFLTLRNVSILTCLTVRIGNTMTRSLFGSLERIHINCMYSWSWYSEIDLVGLSNSRKCKSLDMPYGKGWKSLDWSLFGSLERICIRYVYYRDRYSCHPILTIPTLRNILILAFLRVEALMIWIVRKNTCNLHILSRSMVCLSHSNDS